MRDNGESIQPAAPAPAAGERRARPASPLFWVMIVLGTVAGATALGMIAAAVLRYLESAAVGGVLKRVL